MPAPQAGPATTSAATLFPMSGHIGCGSVHEAGKNGLVPFTVNHHRQDHPQVTAPTANAAAAQDTRPTISNARADGRRARHQPAVSAAPSTTPGWKSATTISAPRSNAVSWLCQLRDDLRMETAMSGSQLEVGTAERRAPLANLDEVGKLEAAGDGREPLQHRRAAAEPPDGIDTASAGIRAKQLLVHLGAFVGEIQLDGDAALADDQDAVGGSNPSRARLHTVSPVTADGVATQLSLRHPAGTAVLLKELLAEVDDGERVLQLRQVDPRGRKVGIGELCPDGRPEDHARTLPPRPVPDDQAELFEDAQPSPACGRPGEESLADLLAGTHPVARDVAKQLDVARCQRASGWLALLSLVPANTREDDPPHGCVRTMRPAVLECKQSRRSGLWPGALRRRRRHVLLNSARAGRALLSALERGG